MLKVLILFYWFNKCLMTLGYFTTGWFNFQLQAITHYSVERQVMKSLKKISIVKPQLKHILEDIPYHFDWSSSAILSPLILKEGVNI